MILGLQLEYSKLLLVEKILKVSAFMPLSTSFQLLPCKQFRVWVEVELSNIIAAVLQYFCP